MVLIAFSLTSLLVAACFYIVEDYYLSATQMMVGNLLYNAAVSGIEKGKGWVSVNAKSGNFPRWVDKNGDGLLSSKDKPDGATNVYEALVAKAGSTDKGIFDITTKDGIKIHVVVYDLLYEPASDLTYEKGFPLHICPQVEENNHVALNENKERSGEYVLENDIGIYLIRCTATYEGRTRIIEQVFTILE